MREPLTPPVLVIGVGNDLRGDDAAGPLAAQRVADWDLPGVAVVRARQLLPEHATAVAGTANVVLIDARVGGSGTPALLPFEEHPVTGALSHTTSLFEILALARRETGAAPRAWVLEIPAVTFDFGAELSPRCEAGIEVALRLLAAVLPD